MKAKTQYNNGQPQLRHETKINSVQRPNPDKQWGHIIDLFKFVW